MSKATKHTLFLREGDMDYIISITPKGQASKLIRSIVSRFVDSVKAGPSKPKDLDVSLDELNL